MKKFLNKNIFLIFTLVVIFLPYPIFAATVYIDTNHSDFFVGDSIIFNVRINSESKNINTVEGNILLKYEPESVFINHLILSESNFSLWPHEPLLSDDLKTISFVGGIPRGLNSKDAVLFKIVLNLEKVGQITLTPSDIAVYLNDGKGTKDVVNNKSLVVNVLSQKPNSQSVNDWSSVISTDKTPPEAFEIFAGQEGSVFNGKKFISFNTTDKQSGIGYYEVIEGNLPPVRSGNTYILQEQNKPVKVVVIAHDISGNTRKSIYNPTVFNTLYPIIIILIIIFLIINFLIFKKKKNNGFIQK